MGFDKQALRQTAEKAQEHGIFNMDIHSETVLALLDELEVFSKSEWKLAGDLTEAQMNNTVLEKKLEAAERRSAGLTEALRQSVIGYKSCLRMGYDRILDLGGDCDSPEVMIAGNPDIQQAEKLLAAGIGKGE